MPKEKKVRKSKSEGRKPVLAEFVEEGFNIFASYQGKEFEARVKSDGVIVFKDKEYPTPNAAANAAGADRKEGKKPFKVNGWLFWRFKKNGEEATLNVIRGSKSPLKAVEAKPKKARKAKASAPKPKRIRKPRTPKLPVAAPVAQEATA